MSVNQSATIRLVLTGTQAVNSGLASTQRSVGRLAATTRAYAHDEETASRRGFLLNQVLFTMRRYAYAGTIALTGLATASVVMGFKFNAAMESNQVAFTQFLGSSQKATQELQFLYKLAKYTPFEFTNVTDAARRFLAFGFTLQQTNDNLKVIGDTVAAFGGGGAEIERMVTVFGQIRASGRLLGQDLLQLEQQGVPVIDILTKKLAKYGVTRAMLAKPGALQIPQEIGIPALLEGLRERFGGASAIQARTFTGQLSTLHDNVSQVMGGLTFGSFTKATKGILPGLNNMFNDMSRIVIKQRGRISLGQVFDIAGKHYPWLKDFLKVIQPLIGFLRALGNVTIHIILPAFLIFFKVIAFFLNPALRILTWGINLFTKFSKILIPVMGYIITLLIFDWFWTRKAAGAKKLMAVVTWLLEFAERSLAYTQALLTFSVKMLTISFWKNIPAMVANSRWLKVLRTGSIMQGNTILKMTAFEKELRKVRMAGLALKRRMIAFYEDVILVAYKWMIQTYRQILAYIRLKAATIWTIIWNSRLVRSIVGVITWLWTQISTTYKDIVAKARLWLATWATIIMNTRFVRSMIRVVAWLWAEVVAAYAGVASQVALKGAIILTTIVLSRFGRVLRWVAAMETVAWIAGLGPIAWITAAVVALIAILVVLFFKWKWFHNFVISSIDFIKDHWKLLAIGLVSPFALLVVGVIYAIKHVKNLINWVKSLVGWLGKIHIPGLGLLKKIGGFGMNMLGLGGMPSMAGIPGGDVSSLAMAGVPSGGGTIPVTGEAQQIGASLNAQRQQSWPLDLTVHSNVNIDGKKVAESTAKHRQDKVARK